MKFSTVLFLAAVGSASAFSPQAPTTRGLKTSLNVGSLNVGTMTQSTAGLGRGSMANSSPAEMVWEESAKVMVQGGSLRTWSYPSPAVERVQVVLKTDGRPLDADIELWQGPDNTPVKMRVYVEHGSVRPFSAVIETPRGPNTISVRNIGQIEFPLAAVVSAKGVVSGTNVPGMTIQGGALRTYPFDPSVDTVKVLLTTDGRPLNARIELLQGPNNNKQVIELYTEDGMDRPFFAEIAAPGSGNVVRIVNTAPVEFPLTATVEPGLINTDFSIMDPVLGGDAL